MIHRSNCPVCSSDDIYAVLVAEDFTVSHEKFSIWQCGNCSLRFTQDVPDENDIAPYYQSSEYISHSDTRKGLINQVYHRVRQQTLKQKRNWIRQYTKLDKGSLLDVGCGTGAFLNIMQQGGWQVTGLEPDEGAREIARKEYQLNVNDISEFYQLPENSFDAITLWHVLEHVHELQPYVEQLSKMLKKDGVLFIAVPNYTSLDAGLYQNDWAAYDVPRHLYHFSPKAMTTLINGHHLRLQKMKALTYDPFYISLLSEKYKHGHIRWFNGIIAGAKSFLKTSSDSSKSSSILYIIRPE